MLVMNIISSPMARRVSLLDRSLVSEQPACTCTSKVSALVRYKVTMLRAFENFGLRGRWSK